MPVAVRVDDADGSALDRARQAAREAALGIGVGGDASGLVVVLAAAPGRPYVETSRRTRGRARGGPHRGAAPALRRQVAAARRSTTAERWVATSSAAATVMPRSRRRPSARL